MGILLPFKYKPEVSNFPTLTKLFAFPMEMEELVGAIFMLLLQYNNPSIFILPTISTTDFE